MVKALYEKETIYEDEIDALFGEDSSDKESLFSSKINRAEGEAIKPAEKAVDKATAKAAVKEDVKPAVTAETDKSDNINEETNENNAPEVTDGE